MSVKTETKHYEIVRDTLNRYNRITLDTLKVFLPRSEPRKYLYDLISDYPSRAGKGFRPGLCIATCKAHGGTVRNAAYTAAALELLHNAFLVHDDVEDDSEMRRGAATLHSEYGVSIAVNVGDAMNALSLRPIMKNLTTLGPNLTVSIFSEIEHMVRQSVEGQAMELGWVRENNCDLNPNDYLRMILKKTCWYTCIHPCRLGALIATGGSIDLDRFNRFCYYMGAAFQIQDDLLNLIGDQNKYGKEIGGDIREGKRTMILIHLLSKANRSEKKYLRQFLATPRRQRTEEDVESVYSLIEKYESIDFARSCARQLAGAALKEFHNAYRDASDSTDKQFVHQIILYMIERDL